MSDIERREGESQYVFRVREGAHLKAEVERLRNENAELTKRVAELADRCIDSIGG